MKNPEKEKKISTDTSVFVFPFVRSFYPTAPSNAIRPSGPRPNAVNHADARIEVQLFFYSGAVRLFHFIEKTKLFDTSKIFGTLKFFSSFGIETASILGKSMDGPPHNVAFCRPFLSDWSGTLPRPTVRRFPETVDSEWTLPFFRFVGFFYGRLSHHTPHQPIQITAEAQAKQPSGLGKFFNFFSFDYLPYIWF